MSNRYGTVHWFDSLISLAILWIHLGEHVGVLLILLLDLMSFLERIL